METTKELPQIEHLNQEKTCEMLEYFRGEKTGWVLVGEKKWLMPASYVEQCSLYYNFKAKPDDTWIVTFPRSGTTWTQELIWLLSNNLDFETAKSIPLGKRFPFLEFSMAVGDNTREEMIQENPTCPKAKSLCNAIEQSYNIARLQPSPRFIKTHFPLCLVPNILKAGCKIVYVARNPKDCAVSYFHFHRTVKSFDFVGDFEKFWNYFQDDLTLWSPYWERLKEAWSHRHDPNFLFLFYEEMHHDLLATVKKVASFLGKIYTDEEYDKLIKHLSFSNFKNNAMVNVCMYDNSVLFKHKNFIREGKNEAWRQMFTPELNEKANKWIEENLKTTDLKFSYIDLYS